VSIRERIESILSARKEKGEFRSLSGSRGSVDFTSNDYLGLSRSKWVQSRVRKEEEKRSLRSGSTGSRLLSGNSVLAEELEVKLADFHNAESALIMNTGFAANAGLIGTLCRKGDVVLYDSKVHASIHQGMALCKAAVQPFQHNDLSSLKSLLEKHAGSPLFVVVESVYSMDGNHAPLKEICNLKKDYDFEVIVDEAHALGVFGRQGRGLCDETDVIDDCLARVYTFGKALGSHGAVIVGPQYLKDYLVNFCKPFIYSTALNDHALLTVEHSYNYLLVINNEVSRLKYLISRFKEVSASVPQCRIVGSGPIFGVIIGKAKQTRSVAGKLNEADFDVRPIVYPTVARGEERIRISLHSYNTEEQIERLFSELEKQLK